MRVYSRLPETDEEGRRMDARLVNDELRREEEVLEARAAELGEFGDRPRVCIAVGDPATVLLEEAAERGAPERVLVAVGKRGLGFAGRLRLGSVSTKLLRLARGPVLIHPRADR
jgi:nucleotide-binding universal stress UspA family protein